MSLSRTNNADKIKPIPIPVINISKTAIGSITIALMLGLDPNSSINANIIIMFIDKFISAEIEVEATITYFGKFIFRIKSPLDTIEPIAPLVRSEKKFHKTIPNKR